MSGTIIVTGSRDWTDYEVLGRALAAHEPDLIVEGGARGADMVARLWAHENDVKWHTVAADWKAYGKAAGSMRNIKMLEEFPEALVIAFPLPQSRGTYHCIREAVKRGHKVMVVKPSGEWSVITEFL